MKRLELQRIENPSDDTKERINELQQSKQDITDMREKKGVFFNFKSSSDDLNPAGVGNPTIDGIGTNQVTMYVDDNMGSKLHESRHGGDVARGTLTNDNYGVHHEVSAYRAQYSWSGSFSYIPFTDFDDKNNREARCWGDIGFATAITRYQKKYGRKVPMFNIYLPKGNRYISFSSESRAEDYDKK